MSMKCLPLMKYLPLLLGLCLAACSDGSQSDTVDDRVGVAEEAAGNEKAPILRQAIDDLTLRFEPNKVFRFEWTPKDTVNVTHYQLLENPDGLSGLTVVQEALSVDSTQTDLIVPLFARMNASYLVQACNEVECVDYNTVFVDDGTNQSIGQLSGNLTEAGDAFGVSTSLSGDGHTLMVGTSRERSAAQGVNGDETDNSADLYSAAYVFVRDAVGQWTQ
ncbi:hypothetical protein [Microbulbifer variabilis]|uniref:hypothetical protein n=1 Tax=Microbulbifer variabilis TaxID=266805 RepID=UPI001CFEE270|nr:hypothetical protein [Microbulbifer variabilis]